MRPASTAVMAIIASLIVAMVIAGAVYLKFSQEAYPGKVEPAVRTVFTLRGLNNGSIAEAFWQVSELKPARDINNRSVWSINKLVDILQGATNRLGNFNTQGG